MNEVKDQSLTVLQSYREEIQDMKQQLEESKRLNPDAQSLEDDAIAKELTREIQEMED